MPTSRFFSPHGGCTEAVVENLNKATNSVLVQAYSFTSTAIAKALVDAHRRGVKVEVILDRSQRTEKYSSATFLVNEGVPTLIDARHAIAHNKVMVVVTRAIIPLIKVSSSPPRCLPPSGPGAAAIFALNAGLLRPTFLLVAFGLDESQKGRPSVPLAWPQVRIPKKGKNNR